MEGHGYSYPESGDSSPHSREIDFDNSSHSWEDQPPPPLPPNHKVKFLLSYGGKIQPRPHDNLLSYVGGETKILAVDRSVKFSTLVNKLTSLLAEDSSYSSLNPISLTSFKYQLPGEELDSLISVTTDDDLEHMMHEYDRLYRATPRPARLRLFAFPGPQSGFGSTGSDPGKLDRECFVEALDSVPVLAPLHTPHNVDLLFGSENRAVGAVHVVEGQDRDRFIGSDPQIEARIQEMNRLQISTQEQGMRQPASYKPRSEENLVGALARDTHQKPTPTIPASVQFPASYWQPSPEHQQPPPLHPQHPQQQPPPPQHQPVYMIHAPPPPGSAYPAPPSAGSGYHAPVANPAAGQPAQGYYQIQRVPSDAAYREQPVYNVNTSQPLSAAPPPAPAKIPGYSEGMGVPVRPVAGIAENTRGYQVVYDSATGRQVYYAAPGGAGVGVVTAPFHGVGVPGGSLTGTEGKVVTKISPN